MSIKVGINGFGRIGRTVLKNILKDPECSNIEIRAINDLTDPATLAHLLKYDSVQGVFPQKVTSNNEEIAIDGKSIRIFSEKEPWLSASYNSLFNIAEQMGFRLALAAEISRVH